MTPSDGRRARRMRGLRQMLVIARRDYVATVFSRHFLMFLAAPLLGVLFGALMGLVSARDREVAPQNIVAVIAPAPDAATLRAAASRLENRLHTAIPRLIFVAPSGVPDVQARALLAQTDREAPILVWVFPENRVIGPDRASDRWGGALQLIAEETPAHHPFPPDGRHGASPPTHSAVVLAGGGISSGRLMIARSTQLFLLTLTLILGGMILSTMVEERSNKVIEVLAAAMRVDDIFRGKLLAMLAIAITGMVVWGGAAALLLGRFVIGAGLLPSPSLGWPLFVALTFAYFITNYLLLGAVFLGIGARANSVREVQTISMPITMGQLLLGAFAGLAVADPAGPAGLAAAIFPFSSALAMLSWAAQKPVLWVHGAALAWQGFWVILCIRLAAMAFRRGVLKSGGTGRAGKKLWHRFRKGPRSSPSY